jgi:hypothetical protein
VRTIIGGLVYRWPWRQGRRQQLRFAKTRKCELHCKMLTETHGRSITKRGHANYLTSNPPLPLHLDQYQNIFQLERRNDLH